MNIAIEGCLHGELTTLYQTITSIQQIKNIQIDLLLVCGDFQSLRDSYDMQNMACPIKYQQMGDFHLYYKGQLKAPILTIFIGGNHEASNYLQELYFGGWVAPNIYYLGCSGVVRVKKGDFVVRIAGLSGIYNQKNFFKRDLNTLPLNSFNIRNVYHTRELEILKLSLIEEQIDLFLSHDWPSGIENYGNLAELLRRKPYFEKDIREKQLGSPALRYLLEKHNPQFWFAAHLHAKFSAIYKDKTKGKESFFLALDKCLPKRDFLQILSLKRGEKGLIEIVSLNEKQEIPLKNEPIELFYDVEWLGILTHAEELYESLKKKGVVFTFSRENPYSFDNLGFQKNNEIINNFNKIFDKTKEKLQKTDLKIVEKSSFSERNDIPGINLALNPQTMEILNKLCIEKERYRGYLYYQGEEMKKEIKLMENNEEINLDLDEEFEHLEEKKE